MRNDECGMMSYIEDPVFLFIIHHSSFIIVFQRLAARATPRTRRISVIRRCNWPISATSTV